MPKSTSTAIVAYVPVIHRGYLQFFEKYSDVETLYVLDSDILKEIDYLRKDVRALLPKEVVKILTKTLPTKSISLLSQNDLQKLNKKSQTLIMPDDDVTEFLKLLLKNAQIVKYPVFLRWDRRAVNSQDPLNPDHEISHADFDKKVMRQAQQTSLKSTNIWRRVAAMIVKNGKPIMASSNQQQPTQYSLWIDGDPRSTLRKGADIEITTDMHAEALLIAQAARRGISLKGTSIYVTTFPCPPCAKLIAHSGIAECYYAEGYATLDGEDVLRAHDIKLIKVNEPEAEGHPDTWVPYRKA